VWCVFQHTARTPNGADGSFFAASCSLGWPAWPSLHNGRVRRRGAVIDVIVASVRVQEYTHRYIAAVAVDRGESVVLRVENTP
jgi:hypothetical protein